MLTDAYPKTVALKDGRSIQLRLLASDDFDRLHAFFLASRRNTASSRATKSATRQ